MNDASDDKQPDLGIGPGSLARILNVSLDILERNLRDHAAANDGTVPLHALRAIRQSVDPHTNPEMRQLVFNGWRDLQEAMHREQTESQRKYPLERLIIQRFDYLLAPHGHSPIQGRTLSRRVIPAFIGALQQMIGPDLYEEYEKRCRDIVDATRNRMGERFSWPVVYSDPGAHVLVTDILVYIARYFDDMERRRHWMEEYFETAMPSGETLEERQWEFGDTEFYLMIDALYQDLQRAAYDLSYAARLKKRYGETNLGHVESLIRNIATDKSATFQVDVSEPLD